MPEFATSIDIEAAPEVVFGFLTTNAGMNAWMGQWADLDARVGGRFDVDIAGSPCGASTSWLIRRTASWCRGGFSEARSCRSAHPPLRLR
jgi:hypothetical protein